MSYTLTSQAFDFIWLNSKMAVEEKVPTKTGVRRFICLFIIHQYSLCLIRSFPAFAEQPDNSFAISGARAGRAG